MSRHGAGLLVTVSINMLRLDGDKRKTLNSGASRIDCSSVQSPVNSEALLADSRHQAASARRQIGIDGARHELKGLDHAEYRLAPCEIDRSSIRVNYAEIVKC